MDKEELKTRTKRLGLRVIKLVEALPRKRASNVFGNQLLRSATSVGANYRSACAAQSRPAFISKLGVAVEEADESFYWLEMIVEAELMPEDRLKDLMNEANEITAILASSQKTARGIAKD
jgi:four helix bundle protein